MKRQLLTLLFCVPAILASIGEEETITAHVRILEKDDAGKVIAVFLETADDVYYIRETGKGAELVEYVEKKVTVSGHFDQDEEGNNLFVVTSYQLAED